MAVGFTRNDAAIERIVSAAFVIPTDAPESDGTIAWSSTTLITVQIHTPDACGIGYVYAHAASVSLIDELLAPLLLGADAFAIAQAYEAMVRAVRNVGRPGLASSAISAVDIALWDLKARLLGLPLVDLLGAARDSIAAYGSGGFTSYDVARLCDQLGQWVRQDGCSAVKMKIGREPERDLARVTAARAAIGDDAELYVDANGAYDRAQAFRFARDFAPLGVTWFEEPVSSDDSDGLRLLREQFPPGMRVAAGEYAYTPYDFRRLVGVVDVLQADATRCGGVTGFMRAAALADAWNLPLSAHTAPSLHASLCCAAGRAINVEYFHDHARIEQLLFEGAATIHDGCLVPDRARPGLGLVLKPDAARFAAARQER